MLHLQIVLPVTAKCLLRLVKADQSEVRLGFPGGGVKETAAILTRKLWSY